MAVRQSPDFGPVPSLPEFLDIFPLHEQITDGFDQQDVFPWNARPESDQIQRRLIQALRKMGAANLPALPETDGSAALESSERLGHKKSLMYVYVR
jgi:hypothetical protein